MQAIDKDECYKNLYIVTFFTGVRLGEICGLSWSAVDFNKVTICIRQQLSRERGKGGKYYIATTKNNKSRVITPAPFVMAVLKEVKREQAENRIRAGKAWIKEWDLVFTNEIGKYMVQQTVWTHFKKIVKSIGKPET